MAKAKVVKGKKDLKGSAEQASKDVAAAKAAKDAKKSKGAKPEAKKEHAQSTKGNAKKPKQKK